MSTDVIVFKRCRYGFFLVLSAFGFLVSFFLSWPLAMSTPQGSIGGIPIVKVPEGAAAAVVNDQV